MTSIFTLHNVEINSTCTAKSYTLYYVLWTRRKEGKALFRCSWYCWY